MKRLSTLKLAALLLALAGVSSAQDYDLSRQGYITITTVAGLPASDINGRIYAVTDGTSGDLCGTGGGALPSLCIYDTTAVAWVPYTGEGGGSSDDLGAGDPGANGLMSRTALNTTVARTITGNTQVSVTNGDGVAGAPTLGINADSIGPTQIDETANYTFSGDLTGSGGNWDFSGLTSLILPSTVTYGSGTTPFALTGFTDDVPPSAPGAANQFRAYVDRSTGRLNVILNGGSAQPYALLSDVGSVSNSSLPWYRTWHLVSFDGSARIGFSDGMTAGAAKPTVQNDGGLGKARFGGVTGQVDEVTTSVKFPTWQGGFDDVDFIIQGETDASASTGDVYFQLTIGCYGAGDAYGGTPPSTVSGAVSFDLNSAANATVYQATTAVDISSVCAAGEQLYVRWLRDADHANDDYEDDFDVSSVTVEIIP